MNFIVFIAVIIVLISLAVGLFSMANDGALNKKYGNKLMWIRVGLQGIAVFFLLTAIVTQK